MKMLNKISKSETPRWDMMTEVKKMQITLDRMYRDLQADGKNVELEALSGAITNLSYLKVKLNNHRTGEIENA